MSGNNGGTNSHLDDGALVKRWEKLNGQMVKQPNVGTSDNSHSFFLLVQAFLVLEAVLDSLVLSRTFS
jgi:hypothetical protein